MNRLGARASACHAGVKAVHNEGSPELKAEGGNSPRSASKVFLEVEDGSVRAIAAAGAGEHLPNGDTAHSAFSNGREDEDGEEEGRGTSGSPYSNRQATVWPSKSGEQRTPRNLILTPITRGHQR